MLKNKYRILVIGRDYISGKARYYLKDELQRMNVERDLIEKAIDYALYKRDATGNIWIPIYKAFCKRVDANGPVLVQRKEIEEIV